MLCRVFSTWLLDSPLQRPAAAPVAAPAAAAPSAPAPVSVAAFVATTTAPSSELEPGEGEVGRGVGSEELNSQRAAGRTHGEESAAAAP